jgi:hypothetical protein
MLWPAMGAADRHIRYKALYIIATPRQGIES